MKKWLLMVIALLMATAQGTSAADIDPSLQSILSETTEGEYIEVLVHLTEQADIQSLNQQLKDERATLAERNRRVILALQEVATRTQPSVAEFLDDLRTSGTVDDYKLFWGTNMFWARIKNTAIDILAARDDLSIIYFNYEIESINPVGEPVEDNGILLGHEVGLTRINATAAWAEGWTGQGRVVMNIDTGVLGSHPALNARFRGDVDGDGDVDESWLDPYTTNWPNPNDNNGHGTHTMGTICGRTASGDTIGVAINAQWIAAAAIDRGGGIPGTVADAIESFQWAIDPDDNPNTQDNPDAIGNSWGVTTSHGYPPCDQTFWTVIDNCEAAGSVVIFSAGNEGPTASSIRRPADRGTTPTNCFSVGAVDGRVDNMPIASFSSRGPMNCGPNGSSVIKPEVVAPGYAVRSSYLGNGYTSMNGTSMASPHVTGAVAVIRQVNPDLDAETVKNILIQTAVETPSDNVDGEDNTFGWGIIDLYQACMTAQIGYGRIMGQVRDVNNSPIPLVQVTVVGRSNHDETDDNGNYEIALPADTSYTFVFSRFGFLEVDTVVAMVSNDTTEVNIVMPLAPGGVLYGTVTDDVTLAPINNAIVEVANTPLSPVNTDQNGRYRFPSIPGGDTYTINVRASGHGLGVDTAFVVTGDSVNLNFSLAAFESFEQDGANWAGTGTWEWGQPTSGPNSAHDGTNVWATNLDGNYNNNSDDMLYSYYYSINHEYDTLTFYHWYEFENSWDGGNVCISTDDGESWALLNPVGNYPDNQVTGLDNLPGYTGTTGSWQQAVFPLIGYQGRIVKFRYWLGTNNSIVRAGWYIDGVRLRRGTAWLPLAPEININPTSISINLPPGDNAILPMTISNTGQGILSFEIREIASLLADDDVPENRPQLAKGEADPGPANPPVTLDVGGPDDYGYIWIDSDEPNGPDFSWIDITSFGQELDMTDDDNDGPYALGFSMPMYTSTFSNLWVCSNGWISFSSLAFFYDNQPFPTTTVPNDLVAPFWDDLNPDSGGSVYFYTDNADSAIVSWIDVPDYQGNGSYTFQLILERAGNITFQYLTMNGTLNSASAGIENSSGTIGLQVMHNQDYITNNLAVQIKMPQDWMDIGPRSALLIPGASAMINIYITTEELDNGPHYGFINIISNDPDEAITVVPCTLWVGPTSINDQGTGLPKAFELMQNYPNPFNPSTQITFALPSKVDVQLSVYDLLGRNVRKLVDGRLDAGYHSVVWDGKDEKGNKMTSGVYFYNIKADGYSASQKMIMIK